MRPSTYRLSTAACIVILEAHGFVTTAADITVWRKAGVLPVRARGSRGTYLYDVTDVLELAADAGHRIARTPGS